MLNKMSDFKAINVTVDATLDEKYGDKILFPEKVARAKASLEKNGLPEGWGTFEPRETE